MNALVSQFGNIDIYLFDQLLRQRIREGMRILDAGCGEGRNLVYFLQTGYEVFAADQDPLAIGMLTRLASQLAPALPAGNFHIEPVEAMSFPDHFADVVISSAVLHFARDEAHFWSMLQGTWRVLRPNGLLFCRLASSVGLTGRLVPISGRRFILPDGSERFLVDERLLSEAAKRLGGRPVDPLKTTLVHDQRSMTTWVLRKGEAQAD